MNKPSNITMQIVLLVNLVSLPGLAHATPGVAQNEANRTISSLTARTFCEQRGGTVTETGNQDVYICCYRQQRKCLASNTRLMQSAVVGFPWNADALQDQRDMAGQ